MIDITSWIKNFSQKLNETFGKRVWFIGLQGSYARGEATETSDIDLVVILEDLNISDIEAYDSILRTMPQRELACGFLAGKNELLSWEPSDLFQFYHDTIPIQGDLTQVLALLDSTAIDRAIKIGVCNIYHGCVHNMLYEKSEDILRGLYKSASFVIQAIVFKQTGIYLRYQKDLFDSASPDEQIIIENFLNMKAGKPVDFEATSKNLFEWSKKWIV